MNNDNALQKNNKIKVIELEKNIKPAPIYMNEYTLVDPQIIKRAIAEFQKLLL